MQTFKMIEEKADKLGMSVSKVKDIILREHDLNLHPKKQLKKLSLSFDMEDPGHVEALAFIEKTSKALNVSKCAVIGQILEEFLTGESLNERATNIDKTKLRGNTTNTSRASAKNGKEKRRNSRSLEKKRQK